MTAPRLAEVIIHVVDLESAVAAWRQASGLEATLGAGAREARIEVGSTVIRLIEAPEDQSGLFELTLAVSGLDDEVDGLKDLLRTTDAPAASGPVIDSRFSHGVPIRLIESGSD